MVAPVVVRSSDRQVSWGVFPAVQISMARPGTSIGRNGVKVPTHLYKLVYDASTQRAWAHWQRNEEGERAGPPISYQELVKRTGIEFLPRVTPQH